MSDWPVNDSPVRRARPAAPRKAYSRVGASAAHANANARASTPRQRRRQVEALMEVRLRPERAAALRVQRVGLWVSLLLLLAALGAGGYLAATRGGAWLLWNNPEYNVTTVDVETDGVIARDAVLEAAEVREGMNIFRLDLDRARARVETLPQVQRVLVQRQLPNKVSILISERKPVAWIAPDGVVKGRDEVFASPKAFLVDASGVLLRARRVLPQYLGLPILRNANADRLAPGQTADSEEVRSALDLLRAHADSLVGARFQIEEVDLSRGYGLLVRDRNGTQVLFGLNDPELQLKTLDNLLAAIVNSGRRAATISLMTLEARQRNIPVTFQPDAPPAPPEAETPPATVPPGGSTPPPTPGKDKKVEATEKPGKDQPADKKEPKADHGARKQHDIPRTKPSRPKPESHRPAKPAAAREPTVRKALPIIQPFQ